MSNHGLNLGQIAFPVSYAPSEKRRRDRQRMAAARARQEGAVQLRVGPMFELVAGQLSRPLKERSSAASTVVSSLVHGAVCAGIFVLISMSEGINLPTPHQASHMVAILVAAPPPPPPPPAAPAPPAPETPEPAPEEPTPEELPSLPPELDLEIPEALPEAPPPQLVLAASPGLNNGLGSGFGSGSGSGFGVEGGVGWGTSASGPGAPVRVGGEVAPPRLVHRVEPVYPPNAVTSRIEGIVVVEATVDEQGVVQSVRVLRSIGPLDQAAIDAVRQWRYSPLRVNDESAQFVITVNVTFRLH